MVRAAVSGAIDYSRADPTDRNWRLKQNLVLREIQRQEDLHIHTAIHQQWLAYISHGRLTTESFDSVKSQANDALDRLQELILPWVEKTRPKQLSQNDTMLDAETQKLVEQYKREFGGGDEQK
jgi:hypothetical protein